MADGVYGAQVKAAVRRLAETVAYGTAAPDPTVIVPLLSESMRVVNEYDQEEAVQGSSAISDATIVKKAVAGAISTELWYTGLEYLWLCGMGFECPTVYTGNFGSGSGGSPARTAASPDALYHLFELDDARHIAPWQALPSGAERADSSGSSGDPTYWTAADQKIRALDLGILKGSVLGSNRVHKYRSCMTKGFTVNLTPKKCSVDWDLVGYLHDPSDDFGSASWTVPERDRVVFPAFKLYMATQGSSWTYSASPFRVAEASIKVETPLADGDLTTGGAPYIEEPIGAGVRKVGGTLKIARYTAAADVFATLMQAGTPCQMILACDSGAIGATGQTFQYFFVMPHVVFTKADFPVAGPGALTGDVEFVCLRDTAAYAYTWLTTLIGGMDIKKQNEMFVLQRSGIKACLSRDRQAGGVTLP